MSPFEQFVQGRLQDLQKPQYYIKRWLHIYGQWEFWALAAVVIGAYYGADAAGWLPRYFVDHPGGLNPSTYPVNALEAECRRAARFTRFASTGDGLQVRSETPNPDFPCTPDLRR